MQLNGDPGLPFEQVMSKYKAKLNSQAFENADKLESMKLPESEGPLLSVPTISGAVGAGYNEMIGALANSQRARTEVPVDEQITDLAMSAVPFGAGVKRMTPTGRVLESVDEAFKPSQQISRNGLNAFEIFMNKWGDNPKVKQEAEDAIKNSIEPYVITKNNPIGWVPNPNAKPTGVIGTMEQALDPKGISDPFKWADSKYEVTKDLLRKHQEQNIPLKEIHTGSDLIARDDYMPLIEGGPNGTKIFMYLSPGIDLAPGRASSLRIVQAANKLSDMGKNVTIIKPDFSAIPDIKGYSPSEMAEAKVRGYKEMMSALEKLRK